MKMGDMVRAKRTGQLGIIVRFHMGMGCDPDRAEVHWLRPPEPTPFGGVTTTSREPLSGLETVETK